MSVAGIYSQEAPAPQTKRKSLFVNQRSFTKGGINRGFPPYLLGEDEWFDSMNMIFDFEKARSIPARRNEVTLQADVTNLKPAGDIDTSLCIIPVGGFNPSPTPPLSRFDFAILRYIWDEDPDGGRDLDTRTYLINTDPFVNGDLDTGANVLGYSYIGKDGTVNDSLGHVLLTYGGDDISPAINESVLIDVKQIALSFPLLTNVTIQMRAHWYGSLYGGNFKIRFQTYLGGTMVPYTTGAGQTDWNNVGGALVQQVDVDRNSQTLQQGTHIHGDPEGTLVINVATQTATITDP